jgi:molybdopterin-guanine dinucleotide biosynthesis protein B
MKPTAIAIIGSQDSGKTTVIEALARELSKRGYKVAAAKHVPEPDFTIDTKGKDTWRFAQAGAKTVLAVSSDEVATIEKTRIEKVTIRTVLDKCKGNDIVFLEGFRNMVSGNRKIAKIVVVTSVQEAREAVAKFDPILAFTGPYSTERLGLNAVYVDVLKNPEALADIVEKTIRH